MQRDADEDALAWDGDDDPTLDAPARMTPSPLPDGYAAVGKGSAEFEAAVAAERHDEPERAQLSNAALLTVGVFAGVYLLYTIGWLIGGLRLQLYAIGTVPPAFFYASFVVAVIAPAVWFAASWLLTRDARTWLRLVWLLVGAVLLVPWPFLMVGTGAL